MSMADLVEDLRLALNDAADQVAKAGQNDRTFDRILADAARELSRPGGRSRTLVGEVTLTANEPAYDLPADFVAFKYSTWGDKNRSDNPMWSPARVGRLPEARVVEVGGTRKLYLNPAPTAAQITVLGGTYPFFYWAAHSVGADAAATTVPDADRDLLLLLGMAQAMDELAARGTTKPATLGGGQVPGVPVLNGNPAALAVQLRKAYDQRLARAA